MLAAAIFPVLVEVVASLLNGIERIIICFGFGSSIASLNLHFNWFWLGIALAWRWRSPVWSAVIFWQTIQHLYPAVARVTVAHARLKLILGRGGAFIDLRGVAVYLE